MARQTCAIIDYGMGNLHSAHGALAKVSEDCDIIVTSDPEQIQQADRVVLPGVGAIRDCMADIRARGVDQVVQETIRTKPMLSICVGLQALMNRSEENGGVECLGIFDGQVRYFGDDLTSGSERLKVPHMGWNTVQQVSAHPMWQGIPDNSRFYFVHSYCVQADDASKVKGKAQYGIDFDVALAQDNIFAVQFHPEKSHRHGLQLLRNFLQWDGQS